MSNLKKIEVHRMDELEDMGGGWEWDESYDPYCQDLVRLRCVMRRAGYECSMVQAKQIWSLRSADWCAGFLETATRSDEELLRDMKPWFIEVEIE